MLKILRAASLPVRTDMGTPAGLYVHCPAWNIEGIGVTTALFEAMILLTTGTGSRNDHPVIAPSELPTLFS